MSRHMINMPALGLAIFVVATILASAVASGAKATSLSKNEPRTLIATEQTQAVHERIAQYFDAETAKYEADAKDHADLAQFYQQHTAMSPKYPGGQQSFQHCDALSKSLAQAAENARQLAAEHREMA